MTTTRPHPKATARPNPLARLLSRGRRTVPGRPDPGTALAEALDLHVRLGQRDVLAGIALTARAGEVLALVGPNGAGKSTLLGALAADLPAASGEVRIDGRPVGEWSAPELALRRCVLPQSAAPSFPFPVEDVVRMGRAPWAGTPGAEADEDALVSRVYRQPVEMLPHPRTGAPLVVPVRAAERVGVPRGLAS